MLNPAQPGAPAAPAAPDASGTPDASGMSGPTNREGEKSAARLWVGHIAVPALEQALVAFGSQTKEGKSLLTAIKALSADFGGEHDDLSKATLMQLMGQQSASPGM